MARPKKEEKDQTVSMPVRFTNANIKIIEEASKRLELPKQEIIRLTSQVGLTAIKEMNREEFIHS